MGVKPVFVIFTGLPKVEDVSLNYFKQLKLKASVEAVSIQGFFIKIINKRFDNALDILSDMIINSVFNKKMIEKEKQIILKEINMVTDDPRLHQWILFQNTIFWNVLLFLSKYLNI